MTNGAPCSLCFRPAGLLARVDDAQLVGARLCILPAFVCLSCWRLLGAPFPKTPATPADLAYAERNARDRMVARGGADRYRVRAGKT